jgi:hypothetical protein
MQAQPLMIRFIPQTASPMGLNRNEPHDHLR